MAKKTQTRSELEQECAKCAQKLMRLRVDLLAAEQDVAGKQADREHLRMRALADGDDTARRELEVLTNATVAALVRVEDLGAVRAQLETELATINAKLRRFDADAEAAALEAMQAERIVLAEALDNAVAVVAQRFTALKEHSYRMHGRASRFGLTHLQRLVDPDPIIGASLRIFDPRAIARAMLLTRHYRAPLAELVRKHWLDIRSDHVPPEDWRPPNEQPGELLLPAVDAEVNGDGSTASAA